MNAAITRRQFSMILAAGTLHYGSAASVTRRERLELNGSWEFCTDPANAGLADRWYAPGKHFADSIRVPGAWQAQGIGKPQGALRHQYEGVAWYRRSVTAPESWSGLSTRLRIGGAHRRTIAFVNGAEVGRHDGFSAPFAFDISSVLLPGAKNEIVLRIENPPFSVEAAPPEQTPLYPTGMLNYIANWGGVYGTVALEAAPALRVESILVLPDVQRRVARFQVTLSDVPAGSSLSVRATIPGAAPVTAAAKAAVPINLDVPVPHAHLWTPEEPHLLTAVVELLSSGRQIDAVEQRFGLREIETRQNVLLLNGKPLYLRGYGDDNIEVLGGFPAVSRPVLVERLRRAKDFGFNAVRFHSMVPPEEYFEVADEVGMFVMAELPTVYTQFFLPHLDFLTRELANVLTVYRNHPSLLSLAFGNEFNLHWLSTDAERTEFLASVASLYKGAKKLAPATLILSNDGFDMRPTDMVSTPSKPPADRPTVRHEFGQYYCSLPDTDLISRFSGVMEPAWLEAKKKWLETRALTGIYPTYLRNSWKLQQLGRKYQIERVRADASITGYGYWLIIDFPGGTGEGDSWEEGWFNYFWEPKGIVPEEGRRINSPVLLMIDAGPDKRTLWMGEEKRIGVVLSNYGNEAIRGGRLVWELRDGSSRIADGEMPPVNARLGSVSEAGVLHLGVPTLNAATKLRLVMKLETAASRYENSWDFWVYPKETMPDPGIPIVSTLRVPLARLYPWLSTSLSDLTPGGLLLCETLDQRALSHLRSGGRVWLMPRPAPNDHGIHFFPASGGALGTLIRNHAAIRSFPHEGYCDLQFYSLIDGAIPFPIDEDWPRTAAPIIGGIRTKSSFLSKSKDLSHVALAIEGRAQGGRLFITPLRLPECLDEQRPEAIALANSLLRYATSGGFQPEASLPDTLLNRLAATTAAASRTPSKNS
ncbi:MAG TPA: glycoside hydrolase family 2 TIM barrel-domain containing protein [Bryobacteraceae bacterium]